MRLRLLHVAAIVAAGFSVMAENPADSSLNRDLNELMNIVLANDMPQMPASDRPVRYKTLTDEDFKIVADELGVEVAAIKAVVKIEAGSKLQGFWAPGVPVANYAGELFSKYSAKTKATRKIADGTVPEGLTGQALREWTSLVNARKKNADAADMGTYWGMFQIGGFNYKLCGCESVEEMVEKICESEFSQLEIFSIFIRNSGMLESLRKKDWATFARKYNGPSYAQRGYHTRMAKEYANFKSEEAKKKSSKDSASKKKGEQAKKRNSSADKSKAEKAKTLKIKTAAEKPKLEKARLTKASDQKSKTKQGKSGRSASEQAKSNKSPQKKSKK